MYTEKDLVRIAKRENNKKRNYLVVNPLQGKHIPISPQKALELFSALADTIKCTYKDETLLLIGFAETATAIGAHAAVCLGSRYIQTTRETIPGSEYLFFSEEHSHAAEQKLVKRDMDQAAEEADRIIFVEDEVTTGNTILNIISVLDKTYNHKFQYAAASLLNGMSRECLETYHKKNIPLHYLVKTDHTGYGAIADGCAADGDYYVCRDGRFQTYERQDYEYQFHEFPMKKPEAVPVLPISGMVNARRLTDGTRYAQACETLWRELSARLGTISGKRLLVAGTEEFMYPALFVGRKLEERGNEVKCHSTTRSPITVSKNEAYPLHSRYELRSLYDVQRTTYLYEIGTYDIVIVVTDAACRGGGFDSLIQALSSKNVNIIFVVCSE